MCASETENLQQQISQIWTWDWLLGLKGKRDSCPVWCGALCEWTAPPERPACGRTGMEQAHGSNPETEKVTKSAVQKLGKCNRKAHYLNKKHIFNWKNLPDS